MSEHHSHIKKAWDKDVDHSVYQVQVLNIHRGFWEDCPQPEWWVDADYRIVNRAGTVVASSYGASLARAPGATPVPNDVPAPDRLSDEDFADGCIRAAVGRLMVPNKTMDDVSAAYHWLGLALGGQRR